MEQDLVEAEGAQSQDRARENQKELRGVGRSKAETQEISRGNQDQPLEARRVPENLGTHLKKKILGVFVNSQA